MDDHWLSVNTYEGPQATPGGNGCFISVVLEDNARLLFSGVRILIVYSTEGAFENLDIVECFDYTRFGIPSAASRPSYREVLRRRSSATHLAHGLATNSPQSVCTVIFELTDTGNSRYNIYELIPSSLSKLEQRRDLRAAFDHVYPCGPAHPPVHVLLNTSHSFRPIAALAMNSYDPTNDRSCICSHSVRVVPMSRRSSSIPVLHPEVLRRIVKLALADKWKGWRRKLLSYGLVCKSWMHVLDLALGGFEEIVEYDHPGVIPVARLLDTRPERAAAIRIFDPSIFEYNIQPTGLRGDEKWEAILRILYHATLVETVRLTYVNPAFAQRLSPLLERLRHVRVCLMNFPNPSNKFFRGSQLSMPEVQAAIAGWDHLETLELSNLREEKLKTPARQLRLNLRKLTIQSSVLWGFQLLSFLTTPAPRLRELHLNYVRDLSNQDLLAFLTAVAPTLSNLIVSRCTLVTQDVGEEYAIDAAIPIMTSLERLSTDGYCATALSISRAIRTPAMGLITRHISMRPADGVSLASVAKAIEVTGWSSVTLNWTTSEGWDEVLAQSARRTAQMRGIAFDCRVTRVISGRVVDTRGVPEVCLV
ncbi:hypothetical protein DXG01_002561 [Tephrocybe rancida]|nr:hypothetical protein DXG01_002561 [Tephrocybe rancida]